ncbi:MAG: response regulator transcription factor [Pontibacterium sp.]
MHVLVADDDTDILTTLADQLELHGIAADCATSGNQVLSLFETNAYDVILLDVMMPGGDGLSACRRLRDLGCTTPVLFLSARDTLDDKIAGFQVGADDYLVKPFAMKELICRVQALGQRISRQQARLLVFGELVMDLERATVTRSGTALKLNQLQFRLLRYLMTQAPKVLTREQLEYELWKGDLPDSDALRSHLYQLRKIIDKPFERPMLETVRGMGYRLSDTLSPTSPHTEPGA